MEQIADYGEFVERPTDDKFARLAELVQKQRLAQHAVLQAQTRLAKAQEELRTVAEQELPEFMENELGLAEIILRDGTKIEVKEAVRAGITKEKAARAFAWLRDVAKAPHLIKHVLKLELGKGEDEKARKFLEAAGKLDLEVDDNTTVHPQTLAAWVREKLEAGALPDEGLDLLGVIKQKFTKIT